MYTTVNNMLKWLRQPPRWSGVRLTALRSVGRYSLQLRCNLYQPPPLRSVRVAQRLLLYRVRCTSGNTLRCTSAIQSYTLRYSVASRRLRTPSGNLFLEEPNGGLAANKLIIYKSLQQIGCYQCITLPQ